MKITYSEKFAGITYGTNMQLYWCVVLLAGLRATYAVEMCFDQRDCSILHRRMQGQELIEYCQTWKNDPVVKMCKQTCQFCNGPAPAQDCRDESERCDQFKNWHPDTPEGKKKVAEFCEVNKHHHEVQKCKATCRFCPPYLLDFPPHVKNTQGPDLGCRDESRTCDRIINRFNGVEDDILTYCHLNRHDPEVQRCKKTCRSCTPPDEECKDESQKCQEYKNWYSGNPEGLKLFCENKKDDPEVQKCKATCANLCTPPVEECKDESQKCQEYKFWYSGNPEGLKSFCENKKHDPEVQKCKATCTNLCNTFKPVPECKDEADVCINIVNAYNGDAAKILRFCERNKNVDPVLQKCKRTCQICGDGRPVVYQPAPHPTIKDRFPDCKDEAENCFDIEFMHESVEKNIISYCDRYKDNATVRKCRRTCRLCNTRK